MYIVHCKYECNDLSRFKELIVQIVYLSTYLLIKNNAICILAFLIIESSFMHPLKIRLETVEYLNSILNLYTQKSIIKFKMIKFFILFRILELY